jgi:putative transposase
VPIQPRPRTGQDTGSDRGLDSFATLATGEPVENPRLFRVWERQLQRAQRRVARRVKGRRRRREAVRLLARAHQKVRRARQDFHQKAALALVRPYDTVSHEALRPANLLKNHQLAKRSSAAGWSACLSRRSCKAADAGTTVVAVPPAYTSQACSEAVVCASRRGRSVRWHACPDCGASRRRDHHAARNILKRGRELTVGPGMAPQALRWAVGPSVA